MTIPRWREVQRKNFTNLNKLIDFLELDPSNRRFLEAAPKFPLNLPLRLAEKIEKNNLEDPILLQFVPLIDPMRVGIEEKNTVLDPTSDLSFQKSEHLLQKYAMRALILTTSACAMHCRYCFRQNFPYSTIKNSFQEELQLIKQDSSLKEIILSGGDPLSLSNQSLSELIENLDEIPHLRRLRFHSRFPIGIPERIDEGLLAILNKTRLQVIFVTHVNHARELDEEVLSALKMIQKLGVLVLNSSVLLKGVNDRVSILEELSNLLSDHGILPYYLHALDPVRGSSQFDVPIDIGKKLINELQECLSGYSVPKFVKEIPFEKSKTPL